MFDLPGDPDEEERRRQLLSGLLGGGGIMPHEPSTATAEATPTAAPALRAPDTSFMQSGPQGLGGYRPPPAAAPEFMNKVQSGHEFGMGDIAMIGGILAALLSGHKQGGAIAGALAGQYGQGIIGDMQQRNARNAEIDKYNNKLANENTEYDRWKADTEAQLAYGNLEARKRGMANDEAREKRIAERLALQDDPDSALNQGEVTQAERLARARSKVSLDEAQKRSDIELNQRRLLAELLGKGKHAAPTGKGGGAAADPLKALKRAEAEAKLKGIQDGTYDPLTGKPKLETDENGNPVKPKTAAQIEREEKRAGQLTPFEGTEVEDPAIWEPAAGSSPNNREKLRREDATLAAAVPAMKAMAELRRQYGTESGFGQESGDVVGRFNVEKAKVESALGVLKNIGVISPTEAANIEKTIPSLSPSMSDASRLLPESWGGGDSTLGKLEGAVKEWEKLVARGRKSYGLRAKSAAPSGGSKAKPGDGFGEGTSGGTRTVTVTYTDGETEQVETDAAGIAKLRAHPDVRSVQ